MKQCHFCPRMSCFFWFFLFRVGLAWHIIGIYCSVLSAFLEPHDDYGTSNYTIIYKLMHHFYLQCSLSYKHLIHGILNVYWSWLWNLLLLILKLTQKTSAVLTLLTAKNCSDSTLLCIDTQHLLLQDHATIFIPVSSTANLY